MKKLIGWLVAVAVIVAVVLYGASSYLLSYSLQPSKKDSAAESIARLRKDYPYLNPWLDSLQLYNALRDTTIISERGERLHAIYVAAPVPTDRTAILVHGYTDEAHSMLKIGYLYNHDMGYNILLPDLHFHGLSQGDAIQMGWLDRLDVMRWMEVANERFGGKTQMVVHGISMGAATTMMVSGEQQQPYVKCFVEDCGYTSVWDQFKRELKEQFHLPSFPLLNVASGLCKHRFGWSLREASSIEQVRKSTLPMLFIHGDKDDYVPTWMVHPLYEAKQGEKELWVVAGATHAQSYKTDPKGYTQHVRDFVGRYIQ